MSFLSALFIHLTLMRMKYGEA
jgi:hypothetical protein